MGKTINGATLRKMFANAFSLVEEKKKDIDTKEPTLFDMKNEDDDDVFKKCPKRRKTWLN